jgi:hypothetical protein
MKHAEGVLWNSTEHGRLRPGPRGHFPYPRYVANRWTSDWGEGVVTVDTLNTNTSPWGEIVDVVFARPRRRRRGASATDIVVEETREGQKWRPLRLVPRPGLAERALRRLGAFLDWQNDLAKHDRPWLGRHGDRPPEA